MIWGFPGEASFPGPCFPSPLQAGLYPAAPQRILDSPGAKSHCSKPPSPVSAHFHPFPLSCAYPPELFPCNLHPHVSHMESLFYCIEPCTIHLSPVSSGAFPPDPVPPVPPQSAVAAKGSAAGERIELVARERKAGLDLKTPEPEASRLAFRLLQPSTSCKSPLSSHW